MARSKTTPELWSLKRLADSLEGKDSEITLEVPSFQRQYVWNTSKQAELVNSIRAGYPIGSIIICNSGDIDAVGKQIYFLVDGLQRSLTIKALVENPFLDAKGDGDLIIDGDEFVALQTAIGGGVEGTRLQEQVAGFLKDVKRPEGIAWQPARLIERLQRHYLFQAGPVGLDKIRDAAHLLLEKIRSNAEILLETKIAVLRAEVPVEHINEVFRRINDSGVTLTKYQIWAASWLRDDVDTQNLDILNCVSTKRNARAKELEANRIKLRPSSSLSLYDYLDGMGRLLAESYPYLFRPSKKPTDETAHAFIVAALINKLRIDKRLEHDLPRLMREAEGQKQIRTTLFEKHVLSAAAIAAEELGPLLSFQTYDFAAKKPKFELFHSDYFISALIAWVGVALSEDATVRKSLKHSLLVHYVFEQMSPAQRSHATDVQAFESVWKVTGKNSHGVENIVRNPAWSMPIAKDAFIARLNQWFESDLNTNLLNGSKRVVPSTATKLLLRLVMLQRSKALHANLSYEVDHLVPWSRFATWIDREHSANGWPINSIGNLALVPRLSNQGKGKLTVQEWLTKSPRAAKQSGYIREVLALDGELLNQFDLQGSFNVKESEFRELMQARWTVLRQIIVDSLFENAWK